MLADLCWPGLFNKISFMKTISVLVLLQRNVHVQKTEIYAFSTWKHEAVNVLSFMYSNYVFSQTGRLCFAELFEKGSEIHKKRRCFYLCVMSNAFIFWWFSKHGWNLPFFFCSHQWKPWSGFNWCLIPKCWE